MSVVQVQTQAILFDMDGVLISSTASANRCWPLWAKHFGMPGWETFRIPHGMRAIEIVKKFRPEIDPNEGLAYIEDMEIEDIHDIEVLPGAAELLKALPRERWTIVTSAGTRLMEARVRAASLPLPQRWIAAEDVDVGKPDPLPYRRGAELLGREPSECVVVEDAQSGVRAGKSGGCCVIGVLGTYSAEQLKDAGANWVIASLRDLRASEDAGQLRLTLEVVT